MTGMTGARSYRVPINQPRVKPQISDLPFSSLDDDPETKPTTPTAMMMMMMTGQVIIAVVKGRKSFTLILQALDMYNESYSISEQLIDETSYSGVVLPSHDWHTLDHIGKSARITYRVRVQCADNYYNTTCTTFCRPRNDQFGHYTCGKEGNKVCLPGWQGANCEKASLQIPPKLRDGVGQPYASHPPNKLANAPTPLPEPIAEHDRDNVRS
uniref:Delta-like protein n=1 Tax=Anopheles atroparvus TaxID=41427 RepID=A0A182JD50_ANOAO